MKLTFSNNVPFPTLEMGYCYPKGMIVVFIDHLSCLQRLKVLNRISQYTWQISVQLCDCSHFFMLKLLLLIYNLFYRHKNAPKPLVLKSIFTKAISFRVKEFRVNRRCLKSTEEQQITEDQLDLKMSFKDVRKHYFDRKASSLICQRNFKMMTNPPI